MEVNFLREVISDIGLTVAQREAFTRHMQKVLILIYTDASSIAIGHGVLVNSGGLIATACHLFDSDNGFGGDSDNGFGDDSDNGFGDDSDNGFDIGSKVTVKWNDENSEKKFIARIVKLDKENDIALLQVKKFNFPYASFADEVSIGQAVHMVVSNDGTNFEYATGTLDKERRRCDFPPVVKKKDEDDQDDEGDTSGERVDHMSFIAEDTPLLQVHNLHGTPGCSGAPVFNSRGLIVGIYSLGYCRMDILIHFSRVQEVCASAA